MDQTGIVSKALSSNQPFRYAPRDSHPKHIAQEVTLTEATVPVLRKCRMVWDAIRQIKTTKPAIGQIQMDLFAQPPLRADAKQYPINSIRICNAVIAAAKLSLPRVLPLCC